MVMLEKTIEKLKKKSEEKKLMETLDSGEKFNIIFKFRDEVAQALDIKGDERLKELKSIFETYREFAVENKDLKRELEVQKMVLQKEGISVYGDKPDASMIDIKKKRELRVHEENVSKMEKVEVTDAREFDQFIWGALQSIVYNLKIPDFSMEKFDFIKLDLQDEGINTVKEMKWILAYWLFITDFETKLPKEYGSFNLKSINQVRQRVFRKCKESEEVLCTKEQLKILNLALNQEKRMWLKEQGISI